MRGAERRQALVRNAAPVARLAVGPVSGSPETPAGSPTGAPLGALLRRSSLRRRAALSGPARGFRLRRPFRLSGENLSQTAVAERPPSASSWQGDIAPGRSPDAARVPVASRTPGR